MTTDEIFKRVISGIAMILMGLSILGAYYREWDWFIDHPRVMNVMEFFGEKGSKILYSALGAICIVIGALILIGLLL